MGLGQRGLQQAHHMNFIQILQTSMVGHNGITTLVAEMHSMLFGFICQNGGSWLVSLILPTLALEQNKLQPH